MATLTGLILPTLRAAIANRWGLGDSAGDCGVLGAGLWERVMKEELNVLLERAAKVEINPSQMKSRGRALFTAILI